MSVRRLSWAPCRGVVRRGWPALAGGRPDRRDVEPAGEDLAHARCSPAVIDRAAGPRLPLLGPTEYGRRGRQALPVPELPEQVQQRGAQRLQLLRARQLRPALLDARGGRVR